MSAQGVGYDLGCHIYSQDGRVYQIEYAEKAVGNGGSLLGVRCKDGVVLVGEKTLRDELLVPKSGQFIHKVDSKSGLAFTGYVQDGRAIVPMAKDECSNYKDYYGESIPPSTLAERLSSYFHLHTIYGGYRPFGIGLLVTGFDDLEGRAFLHMINAAGVTYRFFGAAMGRGRQAATTELENVNWSDMTCEAALARLAEVIVTIREGPEDREFVLEAGWLKDKEREFQIVTADVTGTALAAAKVRVAEREQGDAMETN